MKECVYVPESRYVKNYHVGIHNRNQSPHYDDIILSVIESSPTIDGEEFVRQVALKDGIFRTPCALEAKLRNAPSFYAATTGRLRRDLRRLGKQAKKLKKTFIAEEKKRVRDIRAHGLGEMVFSGDVSKLGEMMTLTAAAKLVGSEYRLKESDRYFDTQTGLVMVETRAVLDVLRAHGLPSAPAGKRNGKGTPVSEAEGKSRFRGRGRTKGTPRPRTYPDSELREMIVTELAAHPGMMVSELRKKIPCHNWRIIALLHNMAKDGALRSEPTARKNSLRYYSSSKAVKMEGINKTDTESLKQRLIDLGKAKGFLTYDDINDHIPEEIVSSDQINEWLSILSDEGIAVVDSATNTKLAAPPTPSDEWIKGLKTDSRFMPYYFKHIKDRTEDGSDDRAIFDLASHNPDISAREFVERIAKETSLYRFPAGLQLRVRQNRMHLSHDTRPLCHGLDVMKKELKHRANEWRKRERADGGSVEVSGIGRLMSRDRAFKEIGRVSNRLRHLPYVVDRDTGILLYRASDVMAVKARMNAPVCTKPLRPERIKDEVPLEPDVTTESPSDRQGNRLDKVKNLILSYLCPDRPMTISDLYPNSHTTRQCIKMALALLMEAGKVRKEPGRTGRTWNYYLVGANTATATTSAVAVRLPQDPVATGKATRCGICKCKIVPGGMFCGKCGEAVTRKCPRCNWALGPKDNFCMGCGRKIEKPQP